MIGNDGCDGHCRQSGQLLGERGRARFKMQPLELQLCGRELCLKQIAERIDACFGALLFDINQPVGERFLLLYTANSWFTVSSSM